MRFSALSLLRAGLNSRPGWPQQIAFRELGERYDVVIIGGGGHGLATAYYLAKQHGCSRIAVLERGWIGGGNTGRNTAVTRANYLRPESNRFYRRSLSLYAGLSRELNYNIMLSEIGVVTLAHDRTELELFRRRCNAMQLLGISGEMMSRDQLAVAYPRLNLSTTARYPVFGGLLHRHGGISRHDAVAWGYARAASALGVDIIQNCEVTDIDVSAGVVRGVVTRRGRVSADRVAIAVAGHSSRVAAMAGVSMPVTSQCLQAMVSEPVKPCLDGVVISQKVHCYVSQSDRGELVIGGGTDPYTSYAQRGSFSSTRDTICSTLELFPSFDRLKLMRQWGGIVDISPDSSPIISGTPVAGLYISGGWGTGGYKAIPAGGECLAYLIAQDRPDELSEPFSLQRFQTGRLIDESLSASVAH